LAPLNLLRSLLFAALAFFTMRRRLAIHVLALPGELSPPGPGSQPRRVTRTDVSIATSTADASEEVVDSLLAGSSVVERGEIDWTGVDVEAVFELESGALWSCSAKTPSIGKSGPSWTGAST
jgi:hypothetical protein